MLGLFVIPPDTTLLPAEVLGPGYILTHVDIDRAFHACRHFVPDCEIFVNPLDGHLSSIGQSLCDKIPRHGNNMHARTQRIVPRRLAGIALRLAWGRCCMLWR